MSKSFLEVTLRHDLKLIIHQNKVIKVENLCPLRPNKEEILPQDLQTDDHNQKILSNKMLKMTLDCLISGNLVLRLRNRLLPLLPVLLQHKEVEYNHLETHLLQHLIIFLNFHVLQSHKFRENERLPIM
jgi:hypothetical protein